jgi:hypothetical protein
MSTDCKAKTLKVFEARHPKGLIRIAKFDNNPRGNRMRYLRFYYYHCVNTSAGGVLVHEGIIRPEINLSALTWFIRYMSYRNILFLNNVVK